MSDTAKGKILIVDDDEYNIELLQAILETDGHQVIKASNGQEALDKLEEAQPDIVMLDVQMPVMDGLEACRRIRRQPHHRLLPVMILTAANDPDVHLESIQAGANDFGNKPYTPAIILARAKSLIQIKKLTDDMENAQQAFIAMVRVLEAKDPYTHGHSERVAILTSRLSEAAGLSEENQTWLLHAGMLHDLGKIAVKESVLHKPDRLSDEEFEHIKSHPVIGEEILQDLKFTQKLLPAIRHHHEHYAGKGYPDGLAGDDIPLDARLMAIVDSYDAMTSNRPYRRGMSPEKALSIITENHGTQWEPELVHLFEKLFSRPTE